MHANDKEFLFWILLSLAFRERKFLLLHLKYIPAAIKPSTTTYI